ncbi:hypothetical protein Golax_018471 [Gossypium laxum]|uniref:Uncharacterized protein n=2 Tax=Gossypium TaxID=3633 RepID=A0A7J8LF39_9ROSI|nr:hypothetical protein [Gossypium lobatum]MBA0706357.1 hypothetical protein [Gossypium laxum]
MLSHIYSQGLQARTIND